MSAREPSGYLTLDADSSQFVSGNAKGRRKVHADSAARVRAHRDGKSRLDVLVPSSLGETIASLSSDLDVSRNDVVLSLIRFALTNRNWRTQGLWGAKDAA